jgi:hypothetical protein
MDQAKETPVHSLDLSDFIEYSPWFNAKSSPLTHLTKHPPPITRSPSNPVSSPLRPAHYPPLLFKIRGGDIIYQQKAGPSLLFLHAIF